jgi:tetratricopeptide (TPR) repeat protein
LEGAVTPDMQPPTGSAGHRIEIDIRHQDILRAEADALGCVVTPDLRPDDEALATGEAALRADAPAPYNRAYLVGALSRLGLLRERLGRRDEAAEALDRALATARGLGTRQLVAEVLLDRGSLARESGDLAAAVASHEEALGLAAEARLEVVLARALGELGWDRLEGGDPTAALALFERALGSKAATESPEIAGALRSGIARAREALGERALAAAQDDQAVDAVESVRLGSLSEARRLGYWRLRQGVFRSAIALRHRLLVDTGEARHAERAFELAEQARARTLLDLVSRGVGHGGAEDQGRAWTIDRLRAALPATDAGVVAFLLDEPRSWAWVLTRDACAMAALPGRGEVERAARAFRLRLASADPYGPAARAEAARLHALLLSSLAAPLAPLRRLVVAADGVLHLVPFEALEDEAGRLLLERHVVSYAPSASVAGALHERHSSRGPAVGRLLAYAEPPSPAVGPLPLARREAEAIAALFPPGAAEVRTGREASERWLKSARLADYGALHFATHGTYDDRAPGRSALVLAPGDGEDGMLQVREIAALALRARLVSLSACDTGLGEVVTGEGVLSLARAFLDAGADAVAMALWRIPDASTAGRASSSASPATPATACRSPAASSRSRPRSSATTSPRSPTSRPRSAPPRARCPGCRASRSTSARATSTRPGDAPDVLVAMNPAALKVNLPTSSHGGIVIVNTDDFTKRTSRRRSCREPARGRHARRLPRDRIDITKLTCAALAETRPRRRRRSTAARTSSRSA